MKRIISAILCVLIIVSALPALAGSDWEYTLHGDEITITRYAGELSENLKVTIPKTIEGKKVSRVANGTFEGVENLRTLEIPRKNVEIKDESLLEMESLVILCRKGGSVEEFCLKNGIDYVLIDDETATPEPTESATDEPTALPTDAPTPDPTALPTEEPTNTPTEIPTQAPTAEPTPVPEPTEIVIGTKKITLGKGQTWQIPAAASPEGTLTYKSRDKKIAKVSKAGVVTAVKNGTTKIDVSTANGLSATVKITVVSAPSKITANPGLTTLGVGETTSVTWSIPSGSAASVTFKSGKPAVASVSEDGVITALSEGKSKITVSTHNGKKATFTIKVNPAPTSIACEGPSLMGVKQKFTLNPSLSSGASSKITYKSSNPDCAKVSSKGVITAKAPGEVTIRISTYLEDVFCEIPVTITRAPSLITFGTEKLTLGVGDKHTLQPDAGGCGTSYTFKSSNKAIAKVNSKGVVTALKKGTAYITATAHNGVSARLRVNVKAAPSSIRFQTGNVKLFYKDTFQLAWSMPADSHTGLTFTSSNESIAIVDENGLVTGVSPGQCKITVTTSNGKSDTCNVTTYDETYPISITMDEARCYVKEGDTFKPSLTVHPETADASMTWKTSRKAVAEVSAKGVVTGKSHGSATITGTSTVNPDINLTYEIVVLSDDRCLVMPEQRTGPESIATNMAKIDNVLKSAYNQTDILLAEGVISQAEYNRRRKILRQAFDMYAFPFMVEQRQPYWRAANSEGGKKDFIPGVVYYGLPYISGSGQNRRFNASTAVAQKYYKENGDHYIMNQKKRIGGNYVGNDCSSFVSMATWGTSSAYSYLRTTDIATSPVYKTISDKTDLRPGDIINRSNSHSIMFLYYADKAKKQMVILEQGGRGDYTNTIWCSIVNVSTYLGNGYNIRRLKTW